jgi:hypothetical protein
MNEMTLKKEAKKAYNEHMADYRLGSEHFMKLCDKYGWEIMEEVVTEYSVWKNGGDIRDVISIGKLVRKSDGPQEIEQIMETMSKYGMEE